jgi:hypothetical protein
MSNKKLSQLAIIAAISIIAAAAVHYITNRPAQTPQSRAYLIQGLDPGKVAGIIISANDKSINLQRRGKTFVVSEKDNYPATTERINELFTEVLDIKTKELITDKPENHPDLEVTQDKAGSAVQFLDNDANVITGVVMGKRTEGGDVYARLADSNMVYLCENVPWIRTSAMDYIDQKLISAERQDIISVTVTDANGITYTLESEPNSSEITLAGGLPSGKKLDSHSRSVFDALASLRFDDVVREGAEPNKLTFNRTYIARLNDSTEYILKLTKTDRKTYATCSAIFTDKQAANLAISRKDSDEDLKKKEALLLAHDTVEKFNAKCKGWVYELPSWKANNLTKPLDDILEDIEEKKEERDTIEDANAL